MFQYQPPTMPQSRLVFSGRVANPTTQSTVDFVAKRLPPINPAILHEIKTALEDVRGADRESIVQTIKSDPALFMQTARRLPSIAKPALAKLDPLDALYQLEDDRLRELFAQPFPVSHKHTIADMNKQQALSLKVTIACAKYAEALAKGAHLPVHSTFSNALFRQIGLNIVAWNYPAVYSRAMANHRARNADPHAELERILGISPRALGLRLASQWGIHLSLPLTEDNTVDFDQVMELAEICAHCEDPQNYPEAARLLESKEEQLSQLIGSEQINVIRESIDTVMERFEKVSPAVASLPRVLRSRDASSPLFLPEFVVQCNPSLTRTTQEVKTAFAEVYSKIERGNMSLEALRLLVEKVVPALGFRRGCLYLTGRDDGILRPALRIGDYPLTAYDKLLRRSANCIRSSLDMLTAMRMDGIGVDGEIVSYLCASLNHMRLEGVLYLELTNELRADPEFQSTLLFNVVRQTLKDCLEGR